MGIKIKTIFVLIVLPMSFFAHAVEKTPGELYSQKTLLKNWALSVCLAAIAKDPRSEKDASVTASAFMEFGHQPIDVYHKIAALSDKFVAKKYAGSVPSEYNTMKCIDLFHSKELDEMTARYSKVK